MSISRGMDEEEVVYIHSVCVCVCLQNGILSAVKEQTEWKPQLQKTNQTDHLHHSLV